MKCSLLIVSCCFTGLGIGQVVGYLQLSTRSLDQLIKARGFTIHKESKIPETRTTFPPRQPQSSQANRTRSPPLQAQTSSVSASTREGNTNPSTHQGSSSHRLQRSTSIGNPDDGQASNIQGKAATAQNRLVLPSSLFKTRLGWSEAPLLLPIDRRILRQKPRITQHKRPRIPYAQAREYRGPVAAGFALVKGPATIQKFAGEEGIQRSSEIKANEQAIVKVRHKSAISIGGYARPGGSITAMARGDTVGAWVDATTGGHGYIRDESDKKTFKDADQQTVFVLPGQEVRNEYYGDQLADTAATVKTEIKGPGVLSIAAARVPRT